VGAKFAAWGLSPPRPKPLHVLALPATKQYLVNFRLKNLASSSNDLQELFRKLNIKLGNWVAKDSKYVLGAQFCPVASQSIWNKHTNKQSYLSNLD